MRQSPWPIDQRPADGGKSLADGTIDDEGSGVPTREASKGTPPAEAIFGWR